MATGNYDATINVRAKVDESSIKTGIAKGVKGGMQQGSKQSEGILNRTVRQMGNRISLTLAQGVIDGFRKGMVDAIKNVKELNDAQTEFKKVSELNGKALDEYTAKAAEMGKEVGRSGREMIEAATEFRKSNFGDADSLGLARIASLYQNIADEELNAADASSFIISQLKAGFSDINKLGSDTERATYAINALNEVSNNFAVSSSDLSKNIGKTSAAMATGNVTYAQTLGMMTGMTEVTRNAATSATSLTRIQSRFNQILDESSSTGKKLTEWYGEHGIAVRNEKGELRSLFEVLSDVSDNWDKLSDDEKRYFALTQGSATQSNRLMALMGNYATTIEAVSAAENSANSASKENAKYQESLAYALKELNAAWEKLSTDLISSGALTKLVNAGTEIINMIDMLVNHVGALPTLFTTITASTLALKGAFNGLKLGEGLFSRLFGVDEISGIKSDLTDTWKLYTLASMNIGKTKGTKLKDEIIDARKQLGLTRKEAEKFKSILASTSPELLGDGALIASNAMGDIASETTAVKGGMASIVGSLKVALPILATIAVIVGSIEIDKYFSFDGAVKRLEKYKDELKEVQSEIANLRDKQQSDKGLTSKEKTHLDVLLAQERSLQRQIDLEQKRAAKAFKEDSTRVHTEYGYAGETGLKEIIDFNRASEDAIAKYEALTKAKERYQYLTGKRQAGFELNEEELKWLTSYEEQADDIELKWLEAEDKLSEIGNDIAAKWYEVVDTIDYSELNSEQKAQYDELHRAFLQNQVDIDNVTDDIGTFRNALSNLLDGFSGETLNLFDDIDIASFETVDDIVSALSKKIKKLDDDTEIKFEAKDETGNVIGKIEGKKSDLTDKEWKMVLRAQATGDWSKVEEWKNSGKASEGFTSVVTVEADASDAEGTKKEVQQPITTDVKFEPKNTSSINSLRSTYGKSIDTYVNFHIGSLPSIPHFADGKDKYKKGGMAWLGDEGSRANPKPELVVSKDGAYLAGTQGWEMYPVKDSDTVYTAAQTKKLLGGKQSFSGSVGELPRYKKGKKSTKQKKREEFEKKLEQLEHKRKVKHWTDAKFMKEYGKLYDKYRKWLKKDQKWDYREEQEDYQNERDKDKFDKDAENILTREDLIAFKNRVKANTNLSEDEKKEIIQDARNKFYTTQFDSRIGILSARGDSPEQSLSALIADIKKNSALSNAEKEKYAREAYETVAEYNLKAYQNGVKTREETLRSIRAYYEEVGEADEKYYQMLDELREIDRDKEVKRLEDLQEKHDKSLSLAEKYISKELDAVNKQIEADEEEADQLERLNDLQKELTKARSTKVRVYKEGIGFVYERDTEAVEKAEKALLDYQKSLNKSPLEQYAQKLQDILDLFSDLSDEADMRQLEVALGVSGFNSLTGQSMANIDKNALSKWIANNLASSMGYEAIIDLLKDADTSQLDSLLNAAGDTQVSQSLINSYINQHSFARGTLSAQGGLSMVAERLKGELVWLGKGDSVYSNAVSRNLMEWGRYSPAQMMNSNSFGGNQVFNFDKIVLPNVHNADDFYRELQNLPNKALQQSNIRM